MKNKLILSTLFALLFSLTASAQLFPEGFAYQAALRDNNGEIMANQNVTMRFTIQWLFFGTNDIYRETHATTTTEFGMVNLVIGDGTADIGVFSTMTWTPGYQLKVEVDTGSGYVDLGTEVMQAVPYAMKAAQNWAPDGNAGTDGVNDFIGTTDYQPLSFRVNFEPSGIISPDGATYFGYNAGGVNTTYSTTAIGARALENNTGTGNTATGNYCLNDNTSGNNNTANGSQAMTGNTSGCANTAIGWQALLFNEIGCFNTATGNAALQWTSGNYNTANGYAAMGAYNISSSNGSDNVAVGARALASYTIGDNNTAVGKDALYSCTEGTGNTAVGESAMYAYATGSSNVAVGFDAGGNQTAGSQCTFLGYSAEGSAGTFSNATAVGYNAAVGASNEVRIGNSAITEIGGYEPWTNVSDGRFKKNIGENVSGLNFIMKLHPVTYNLEVNKLAAHLKEDEHRDSTGAKVYVAPDAFTQQSRDEKEQILYTGFIAQDVEEAALSVGYDFSGVSKPDNDDDLYGLKYSEFTVPLVKAVQEQQKEIEELKAALQQSRDEQTKMQSNFEARLAALENRLLNIPPR